MSAAANGAGISAAVVAPLRPSSAPADALDWWIASTTTKEMTSANAATSGLWAAMQEARRIPSEWSA